MKKLVFMFAAVVAMSFASCGNGTDANAEAVDSDSLAPVEEEVCCDSACADSAVVDSAAVDSLAQ